MPFKIREATVSDAAPLAAFATAVFRETYASTAAPADLDGYISAHLHADAQRQEITSANSETLLVEIDGALVGFAQLQQVPAPASIASDDGQPRPSVEIKRFYVAPNWHGRGIAQDLMSACMSKVPKGVALWLGVFTHNARAIAFYRKCGFTIVGETSFRMGHDLQRDYVMRYEGLAGPRAGDGAPAATMPTAGQGRRPH
jgi:diamine N-acetyltransferase